MKTELLLSLLLTLCGRTVASPLDRRAQSDAGKATSDSYPPSSASVNTALFPSASILGYPGGTATGALAAAIQTAIAAPNNTAAWSPLVIAAPANSSGSGFQSAKYWGNLAPWFTVDSAFYGLPNASPEAPSGCSVTQIHALYRHGARYPSSNSAPAAFAAKLAALKGGFNATGALAFLNSWTYKLGTDLLLPVGRQQDFDYGVQFNYQYGYLLRNFTRQGKLPVFRTTSQDRMVKTATNFLAGLFGIPEYLTQAQLEIVVEASGYNNTLASYETCPNNNDATKGNQGNALANNFANLTLTSTAQRLNALITGLQFTSTDVVSMMQTCAYETQALGYSAFCGLFTEEDFRNFEYLFDLQFYYNGGFGSPVAAALGKGYLEEFIARLQMMSIKQYDSTTNSTLDNSNITFPLDQSIYADATHEFIVAVISTALNLTALGASGPLPLTSRPSSQSYVASQVVPFATHLESQVLQCSNKNSSQQIRFILNGAVLPIDKSYAGCTTDADGLCSLDTVLAALQTRNNQIDYHYACYGNYSTTPGVDYNGMAPGRNVSST